MLLNISIREICRSVELLSSDSTKYFILHNCQGILNLRGWWCLNSRQSISESSRKKICFRKTKNIQVELQGKGLKNDKKILMAAMSESQGWKGHCHARHLSSYSKLRTQQIQLVHNYKYKNK